MQSTITQETGPPPVRAWGLDPLYWCYVKLCAKNLHEDLVHIEGFNKGPFMLCGRHPINKVLLVGIIVSVRFASSGRQLCFTLDDGTGLAYCTYWFAQRDTDDMSTRDLELEQHLTAAVCLGNCLTVMGSLQYYKGQVELLVKDDVRVVIDPHEEVMHMLEVVNNFREVYSKPFRSEEYVTTASLALSRSSTVLTPTAFAEGGSTATADTPYNCPTCQREDPVTWEAVQYCFCSAVAHASDPDHVFRKAALKLIVNLASRSTPAWDIEYQRIKNDRQLQAVALQVIKSGWGGPVRSEDEPRVAERFTTLYQHTVQLLAADGVLVTRNGGGLLTVLSTVLIKEELQSAPQGLRTIEEAFLFVRLSQRLRAVSRHRVKDCWVELSQHKGSSTGDAMLSC